MSTSSQELPPWFGFVLGVLAGFAASFGLVGLVLGFSLAGKVVVGPSGGAYVPQAPAQPQAPADDEPAQPSNQPVAAIDLSKDHVRGNPNAKVTIIEYSDFECPFCKRHHDTMKSVLQAYGDDVNWVYRHFPLPATMHPNAQKSAEASECAFEQGGNDAFWSYADALFASASLSNEQFLAIAKNLKLNEAKFKSCLDTGKYADLVAQHEAGGVAAGVRGTPGNFVYNNETKDIKDVSGAVPLSSFQALIDPMLGK